MSVSNIASGRYQQGQLDDLTGRIRQRYNDIQEFSQALQTGDAAITNQAFASLLASLNPSSAGSHTQAASQGLGLIADSITAMRKALQDGDQTAAQTAFAQLQKDIQAAVQAKLPTDNQNDSTLLQAAAILNGTSSNLNSLLNSADAPTTTLNKAVNTGLQQFLKILASINVSPVISAGLSGLVSVIGKGINTSA